MITSANTFSNPENYNDPNITITFLTSSATETSYNYTAYGYNSPVCDCKSPNDTTQYFFPNKVNHCIEQVIYTKVGSGAFDFTGFNGACSSAVNTC